MTGVSSAEAESFLALFFGPGNLIDLEDIDSNPSLRPWLRRVRQNPWSPTLLPRRTPDGITWYYALASNPQQLRWLASLVMAFVGPSYSTFRGDLTPYEPTDDLEIAVKEFTADCYFRFTGKKGAWNAICRMNAVLSRQPIRREIEYRGPDRLLRDFESTLTVQDRVAAESVLRELSSGKYFDSLNSAFLRVRLLGEFRAWTELLALPELPDLLVVRRPRVVTSYLLEAAYFTELVHFEESGDSLGAVAHFRDSVETRFPTLWLTRSGFTTPGALKILMLAAVAGPQTDSATRDRILSVPGLNERDRKWLQALGEAIPITVVRPIPTREAAERAVLELNYDLAWEIARSIDPSFNAGSILLTCAVAIDSLPVRRAVLDLLNSYPQDIQTRLRSERVAALHWREIEGERSSENTPIPAIVAAPCSWLEWIDALFSGVQVQRLVAIARANESEWDLRHVFLMPGGVERLVDAFDRPKSIDQENAFGSVLPLLHRAAERLEPEDRVRLKPVYLRIRERLLMGDPSLADLDLHNDVLRVLLSNGLSVDEYRIALSDIRGVWATIQSPSTVAWVLDLLDLLVESPCADAATRANLPPAILPLLIRHRGRLDDGFAALFNSLCTEIGLLEFRLAKVEDSGVAPGASAFAGKTILIYTLQPEVAGRVKQMIEDAASDATVHVSSDMVGSDRLRNVTRQADIVVLASRSAKHAATEFIEKQMRPGAAKVWAAGKGSVSMWRSLTDYSHRLIG
jgi:hypothetical protein